MPEGLQPRLRPPQLDHEHDGPGPGLHRRSVTVNGQPATFKFVQPTYPGDPNGQDDPDPLAHRTGLTTPINADNPNPPACPPTSNAAAAQNLPCGDTKLVITPSAPIPSGSDFAVTVNYTGRPGVRPSPTGTEGWFRNDTAGGEGAMVTSEPTGTEAWMPLNNHPSVKPTYDIYDTVTKGKLAIGPGRLVSSGDNAPDANFPAGSTSYHWKSSEPIANYLVENSVGNFDYSFRAGANDVVYFEAQDAAITAARKALNKVAMDQQEAITHFQEPFTGRSRSTPTASSSPSRARASRRRCRPRSSSSAARSAAPRAPTSTRSRTRTCTSGGATTSPRARPS